MSNQSGPFPTKEEYDRRRNANADGRALASKAMNEKLESESALMRDFRVCFGTPEGRRVYDFITKHMCNIDRPIFARQVQNEDSLLMRCAVFDLGREIERLTFSPLEKQEKPAVKTNINDPDKRGHP